MQRDDLDLGKWVEGVVTFDVDKGCFVVVGTTTDGTPIRLDPYEALAAYRDQKVRMIVTPLATVEKLAALVESGDIAIEQASYKPPKGT